VFSFLFKGLIRSRDDFHLFSPCPGTARQYQNARALPRLEKILWRAFPEEARREAGYQLDRVQHWREPDDWKPMNTIGRGVREIRIRDAAGVFRVLYVAKFDDAVYVLHCFQKKTQKTSKADLNLAAQRYRDLLKKLGQ
jgi:phage-related protein